MGKIWSRNLGVKPTWLLRETGNLALEADPRVPPNQKWSRKKTFASQFSMGKKSPKLRNTIS